MRLFVAAALPQAARVAVAEACAELRESLPRARWVPAGQWHVTLWFVGDTAPEQVDPLIAVLRASVGAVERFTTELGGGGTYPSDRGARVAWVGFREPLAWRGLVAAMAEAAAALAWPVEQRPASPHVTLARPRPPWSQRVSERWRQAVPARLGGPFEVSQAVLYHSKLGPAGARHEALAALPLGGGR